jgi:heterodisulfide reductase subunit A2
MMNDAKLPCTGVYLCECGGQISKSIDLENLSRRVQEIPGVLHTAIDSYPCSKDGQERIRRDISAGLERVLIAGCAPRLVEKLFRETAGSAGLDPSYVHIANIREQCVFSHPDNPAQAVENAAGLIEMGLARLANTTPTVKQTGRVVKSVLVIGHGLSALTVSLSLAEVGIRVTQYQPGSTASDASPGLQTQTADLIAERSAQASAHPMIDTISGLRILEVSGHPGDYEVRFQRNGQVETYAFGAIVIANNARTKLLSGEQWFDRSKVKTQAEFEAELNELTSTGAVLELQDLVFILCADPTQASAVRGFAVMQASVRRSRQSRSIRRRISPSCFEISTSAAWGRITKMSSIKLENWASHFSATKRATGQSSGMRRSMSLIPSPGNPCISPSTGSSSVCP